MRRSGGYIGIVLAFLAAILAVILVYFYRHGAFGPTAQIVPIQQGCTMEAKLCWDGSSVGRTGPNCEFAACPPQPEPVSNSGISGTITLGPTCPVERIPPDPNCADKPYQTTMLVENATTHAEITRFTSAADGTFSVKLPAGTYLLASANSSRYPYTAPLQVVVAPGAFTHITVSYDTGIR